MHSDSATHPPTLIPRLPPAGRRASELLSPSSPSSPAGLIAHQLASAGRPVPTGQLNAQLLEPWADMVAAFLRCLVAQNNGERALACKWVKPLP
jgi:hypothetical protein